MLEQASKTDGLSALFPVQVERDAVEAVLASALTDLPERIAAARLSPHYDRHSFAHELAGFTFAHGRDLSETLLWIVGKLERGIVQTAHPSYFGLFNPAPSFPALCADRIAAAFNPQLASATTSPVPVAIEDHVIAAFAARAGLPAGAGGHFTSGGSEANFTALICALTASHPGFAQHGARCFDGAPRLYVSRDAHLAWIKIAHQAGIGRQAVRLIATDGLGQLEPEELRRALREDRQAGDIPIMIAATAGTTCAGMIDPLAACNDAAREVGIWFHVDAAWGGALLASDNHRSLLNGLETADSVTIDAHKWLSTTMGCGIYLARRALDLATTFRVANDFMPPGQAGRDPYANSVQWSRRFLGLRLFASLAAAGWAGHGAHVNRAVELAELLRAKLAAQGWHVVNNSPLAVLCIVAPDGAPAPADIVQRVVAGGHAWVSSAIFEGQQVIRACITNGRTTETDIDVLVGALLAACIENAAARQHGKVI